MCSQCGCIETPAEIQMPLEGTAALLNRAGSCPSAFLLKCVADTSQNADTRDIVLRACHWVQSPFNAPKPSICHASAKGCVKRQAARVCPLHNCEISQAFFHSLFTSPSLTTFSDNYNISPAYSPKERDGGKSKLLPCHQNNSHVINRRTENNVFIRAEWRTDWKCFKKY